MPGKPFAILGGTGYVGSALTALLTRENIPFVPLSRHDTTDAGRLREALKQANAGCIYTGRRADGTGFTEDDPPNFSFRQDNCSFYSGTKALGEEILAGAPRCYVWRLRIPFDNRANPRNYLQKLLNYQTLLEAENSLSHLDEFVTACVDCFRLNVPYGIYNLTNPGSVWTSEVTDLIRASGISTKSFAFFENEADFMQRAARAPRSNCVLDSSKATAAGLKLTPIIPALQQTLAHWKA